MSNQIGQPIITANSAVEFVITYKAKDKKVSFYTNRIQKSMFWCTLVFFVLGSTAGGVTYIVDWKYTTLIALVLLVISTCFLVAYEVSFVVPALGSHRYCF